jgi:hypothetical protein
VPHVVLWIVFHVLPPLREGADFTLYRGRQHDSTR